MTAGATHHLTVSTSTDDADGLARATGLRPDLAAACRPLVAGLLDVLGDPALAVEPGSARHAQAAITLLAPVPTDVALQVTATPTEVGRLGSASGVWVAVEVTAADEAVVRSHHVVSARTAADATGPGPTLRRVPRRGQAEAHATELCLDRSALDAYRSAAADTSPVHDPQTAETTPIVPGLLVLLAAAARVGPEVSAPARLVGRFSHPLAVDAAATVRSTRERDGGWGFTVEAAGRAVLRATLVVGAAASSDDDSAGET